MIDEAVFAKLADAAFRRVLSAIDGVDAEDAEVDRAGDVVTIVLRGKKKCILNTQRPTRQLWLAYGTHAWHFNYVESAQPDAGAWQDDKGRGELFATLSVILKEETKLDVSF
jgi:CyaY protein